jgi:hypothetical protein
MGFYCYEYNRNGYKDDLEEIRAFKAEIIKIGLDTLKALNRRIEQRYVKDESHEQC